MYRDGFPSAVLCVLGIEEISAIEVERSKMEFGFVITFGPSEHGMSVCLCAESGGPMYLG